MPPLRKSKRKLISKLLHMRDSPRCQSFSVGVPLPMDDSSSLDGSHILTSTTNRGNQVTSKSGMLPPRKSKKYRGDESAKEIQATQQWTTQETSHIPSSTRASTSLEASVSQYASDTIASSPVMDQNSRVLQKSLPTQAQLFQLMTSTTLPKRAYDKHNSSSLPTQATKSTTPKGLNSKLVLSITTIRNYKRRDSEGNKVSHLHAAKKTLQASSFKVSHIHAALPSEPLTEMKSLRPLEKSTTTPCKSTKIDHTSKG